MTAKLPFRGPRRRRHVRWVLALATILSTAVAGAGQAHPGGGGSPPVDPAAPWTPKVTALVGALTLDEKISLVHGGSDPTPLGQAGYLPGVRLGFRCAGTRRARHQRVPGRDGWPTRLGSRPRSTATRRLGLLEGAEGRALGVDLCTALRSTSPAPPTGPAT